MGIISILLAPIIILLVIIIAFIIVKTCLVKANPDEVIVITGIGKTKYVKGKVALMNPLVQKRNRIELEAVAVPLHITEPVQTLDFQNVTANAIANVQVAINDENIKSNDEKMELATKNFLNAKTDKFETMAQPVLEGAMREIIGTMNIDELVVNKEKFSAQVIAKAEPAMNALGLTIATFHIQNFQDADDVIIALGVDNQAKIKRAASISAQENAREVREKTAEAELAARQAEIDAEIAVAERENAKRIKLAELKQESDIRQAEADAAYQIKQEEQRKTLEQASVDADIARQEREIELEEKRVAVEQKRLEAEVNKKAEADRFKAEQEADAVKYRRQREAEASKIEQEQAAEAELIKAKKDAEAQKARAEAAKFAKEQEAAGIEAVGRAEAAAIEAKGIAEAEAIRKKAEAMKQYGEAAMAEMVTKILPEVAANIAKPMENISDVHIYGSGNDTGVDSMSNIVPVQMAKTFDTVKQFTGVDLADIVAGQGKSAKTDRNIAMDLGDDVVEGINAVKQVAEKVVDKPATMMKPVKSVKPVKIDREDE